MEAEQVSTAPPQPSVEQILRPSSIAVVGASDDPGRIGGRPIRILLDRGFEGPVYPVNPKYETVQGLPCFPEIAALPDGVDLYIICLAADAAITAVEQAATRGARAAVIFSGGFAETGAAGQVVQARLATIVREAGIALVGPNCLGVASFVHKSYATFATALETLPAIQAGELALLAQSGGSAFNLFTESYWSGARFSHVIATGNEAGLTFADYLAYLAGDPCTSAVLGYLEGVPDGARFGAALDALRAAGKPVFLLKAGATARGAISVASHTAQLSGNDSAFAAVFERYGVTRLNSMEEMIDVAVALSLRTPAAGLAVATNSGGAAVYLADTSEQFDVPLAPLTVRTRRLLADAPPDFAGLANPIDFTAQVINDRSLLGTTLRILDADETVDVILVFLGSMEYLVTELLTDLVEARRDLTKPLALAWLGVHERVRLAAREAGFIVRDDPARFLRALGLVRVIRRALIEAPGSQAAPVQPRAASADPWPAEMTPRSVADGRLGLDEWQTMSLLTQRGAPTPARRLARSASEARAAATEIGCPCVLKLLDPLIAHRARVGAVRTDLATPDAVASAFEQMQLEHGARLVLVAEQVAAGPEVIVGVLADPTFGTRAVVGAGGVWANELHDTRTLIPPYDDAYVRHEVGRLRMAQRLVASDTAGRGVAEQVAAIIRNLADTLVASGGRITEIECNPVVATSAGAIVLDALAFTAAEQRSQEP